MRSQNNNQAHWVLQKKTLEEEIHDPFPPFILISNNKNQRNMVPWTYGMVIFTAVFFQ